MAKSDISILFQNDDFIAVDKPPGLSVHNNEDPQNLLLILEQQLKKNKLYPVHRLDKETSGVQILALNESASRILAEEFQKKAVGKTYVGLLRGQLKHSEGVWNQSLTDKAEGRKNPAGASKDRVPCETRFHVLKYSKYFTLCKFQLITGRQHQIRKHAALSNHCILGDARYGDKSYNSKMAQIYNESRMFLHCLKIEIQSQVIMAPLPSIFEKVVGN